MGPSSALGRQRLPKTDGDLRAMEATVLYEDFVGSRAGYDDAGEIDTGDVAFEGLRIEGGGSVLAVESDAEGFEELEVGVIAGHGEDEIIFECALAFGGAETDGIRGNFLDGGVEGAVDFVMADAVFYVRENPVFYVAMHLVAAMDKGNAGAVPPEIERSDGCRIFSADD